MAPSVSVLTLGENCYALLHRFGGFFTQRRVIIVGDRMRNHRKGEYWHTRYLGHGLRRLHEPIGNDRRGRDASFLCGHRIVQTARRAAASISDRGDHRIALFHVGNDLGRCRPTGVGFFEADDVGHAVLGT